MEGLLTKVAFDACCRLGRDLPRVALNSVMVALESLPPSCPCPEAAEIAVALRHLNPCSCFVIDQTTRMVRVTNDTVREALEALLTVTDYGDIIAVLGDAIIHLASPPKALAA